MSYGRKTCIYKLHIVGWGLNQQKAYLKTVMHAPIKYQPSLCRSSCLITDRNPHPVTVQKKQKKNNNLCNTFVFSDFHYSNKYYRVVGSLEHESEWNKLYCWAQAWANKNFMQHESSLILVLWVLLLTSSSFSNLQAGTCAANILMGKLWLHTGHFSFWGGFCAWSINEFTLTQFLF